MTCDHAPYPNERLKGTCLKCGLPMPEPELVFVLVREGEYCVRPKMVRKDALAGAVQPTWMKERSR